MEIGILGGGLAGLSVAAHLRHSYEVLEAEERCGGHCCSVQEDGFTYDEGGPHIVFSRNQKILDYMVSLMGAEAQRRQRNNKIVFKGRYVKYPFENGLSDLDPQDRFDCLYSFLNNPAPQPANFKEWLYFNFGAGLTEKYLLPYNEKIWKLAAAQMAMDWVQGRIPKPPLEDLVKSAVGLSTEGYTEQLFYYYPRTGGIETLIRALVRQVRPITTGFTVRQIRRNGPGWTVSDGTRTRSYEKLVATLPVQDLVRIVEGVPGAVLAAADALRYNSLLVLALGISGAAFPPFTALYVPDPAIRFHRLSFPGEFSPANVPAGRSLVCAEITANAGDGVWEMPDQALLDDVSASLEKLGLLERKNLCYSKVLRSKYGYVVQDFGYRKNLNVVKDWFRSAGIALCGRVAEFEYVNMDVCIDKGIKLAETLNTGG